MRAKADHLQDVPATERRKNRAVCRKEVRQTVSTDINNVEAEIARGLTEYDQSVANDIKKIVDDVAAEGVSELKQTSPKLIWSY